MLQIKNLHAAAFLLIVLFAIPVWASEFLNLDKVTGVYKEQFQNDDVSGEKIDAENILEIVKYDDKTVYFRTHLDFYNNHICELSGMATVEGGGLVYRSDATDPDTGEACELKIGVSDSEIVFHEKNKACQVETCGANGAYDETVFLSKNRRYIRYMDKLTKSREYQDAVTAYKEGHKD